MLDPLNIETVLDQFVAKFVPAMQRWGYHLILAKGGRDYPHLPEQSMFTHIINGAFGLARLLKVALSEGIPIPQLNDSSLRKGLALYSIHDVHKLPGFQKLGTSEFAIPLDRLREEYDRLGLKEFANVDKHLMRASNVSKRSAYQGDLLLGAEEGSFLWLIVRIADSIASMVRLQEAETLAGYLKQLAPELGTRYRLYYHEIQDVRGVLTNLIHSAAAQQLERAGFRPLLFFGTGTLYLGPKQTKQIERARFLDAVTDDILMAMAKYGQDRDAAAEALRRERFDFEQYVFAFADAPILLEIVRDETLRSKPNARIAERDFDGIVQKRRQLPANWRESAEVRFGISFSESKTFNEYWAQARRYLLYLDALLRDLNPTEKNRIEWFIRAFEIGSEAANALRQDAQLLSIGGVGKYVTIIAYHFLKSDKFRHHAAESLPPEQVLERLHQYVLNEFKQVDTRAGREAIAANIGFRPDLRIYLGENLTLSFLQESSLEEDPLGDYSRPKRQRHSAQICSICNRGSQYVRELRTGILSDFGRVFSNRVLPNIDAPQGNRLWCAVCHLEFILRKLVGLALPSGSEYGQAYRLYLYVLPTFSFTPYHVRLFSPLMEPFRRVSALPIRDYGANALGAPRLWVERRTLDHEWMGQVESIFAQQTEWIGQHGGRAYRGDRLLTSRTAPQPNYYLIVWDESGDEFTRTEAWAKATFAASVIAALTSAHVFVTEHPYLSAAAATELKPTVTLDAATPVIRTVLKSENSRDGEISLYGREQGDISDLERALDLTAALWVVTADVHAPTRQSKDKQIAERLALAATQPLAGAHFYKEYGRLNDDQSPYLALARACEILLEHLGGEMMDLCERITEKSLEIRLPFRTFGRGKAHSYELVLREGVDALRAAFDLVPELRQMALTGEKPSNDSVTELKRLASGTLLKAMERRQATQRGDGFINPWRKDLGQLVGDFIDLLVKDVFLSKRANGSFATFLRLENNLADGVYYYTDRVLPAKWEAYNKLKAEREAKAA